MGGISRPSNSGRGAPETGAFIWSVGSIEPQIHELWCHRVDRICCEVHPYARIYILVGNVGEFVTGYFSENGRRKQINGEFFINGSVQFIGIYDTWGSGLPFIPNPRDPESFSGWGITGAESSNVNPGFSTVTGSWGGSFADSAVNLSVNSSGSFNASPDDSRQSPILPHIYRHRVHKYLLRCRRQHSLWRQFNRVCWRRQDRDFSNCPATKKKLVHNSVASMIKCVWIARKIDVCVTCVCCV